MKKKIYIYPNTARTENTIPNPYLTNLVNSLKKYYTFVNVNHPSSIGIFDIIKYYWKLDYIMLNWVCNLPDNKRGLYQSFFLILLLLITKITKKSVIWTIHNKLSHSTSKLFIKKLLFKFMVRISDYIITHSKEGIEYLDELSPNKKYKVTYYPHPANKIQIIKSKTTKYDILIWGTIIIYKGIDKFLEFLKNNHLLNKYKILIIGKAHSNKYFSKLLRYSSERIIIKNKYISEDELKILISQSKIVLFTYNKTSVLSSGVLMDTLSYGARIIGPKAGAFKDLAEENLIAIYQNFDELVNIIDNSLTGKDSIKERIAKFVSENSWENYAMKLYKWIN